MKDDRPTSSAEFFLRFLLLSLHGKNYIRIEKLKM